jgi:hypothetical protein
VTAAQTTLQPDLFRDAAFDVSPGRAEGDYYPTPAWLTRALLDHRMRDWDFLLGEQLYRGLRVLDPGAGCGEIGLEVERWIADHPTCTGAAQRRPEVTAVELDVGRASCLPDRWRADCADFFPWARLRVEERQSWPLVVTNPPFSHWQEWVDACLPLTSGYLAVLGFTNILGGQARSRWWAEHRPEWVLVSPKRPSFRGGSSDPRDACWIVWRGYHAPKRTELDWLDV